MPNNKKLDPETALAMRIGNLVRNYASKSMRVKKGFVNPIEFDTFTSMAFRVYMLSFTGFYKVMFGRMVRDKNINRKAAEEALRYIFNQGIEYLSHEDMSSLTFEDKDEMQH